MTLGQIKSAASEIVLQFGIHLVLMQIKIKITELQKKKKDVPEGKCTAVLLLAREC